MNERNRPRPVPLAAALAAGLIATGWSLRATAQDHSAHPTSPEPVEQADTHDPHAAHRDPHRRNAPSRHSRESGNPATSGHTEETKTLDSRFRGNDEQKFPPITDADRAAAFPDVAGHAVHDDAVNYLVLLDQLEWQNADEGNALSWDAKAWIGGDLNRLWLRAEGEREGGRTGESEAHALYGRSVARWWDVVVGIRQDFRPGPSQTWAAVGVQGLSPYKFEVEATAYLGESGQTAARLEAEYELLLTNRLILQPLAELNFHGKDDPQRSVGSGLSTAEAGLRLRYEIRREFAPYVGITWSHAFGKTADFAELDGEDVDDTRLVAGLRIWF